MSHLIFCSYMFGHIHVHCVYIQQFSHRMVGLHSWQHHLEGTLILCECSLRLRHRSTCRRRYATPTTRKHAPKLVHVNRCLYTLLGELTTCFCSQRGWTALSVAAQEGKVDVVRLLTEAKAHVNIQIEVHTCTLCHIYKVFCFRLSLPLR